MTKRYMAEVQNGVVVNTFIDNEIEPNEQYVALSQKSEAAVGYIYENGKFREPQPFPSWTVNAAGDGWDPPVAKPGGEGIFDWYEKEMRWIDRKVELDDAKPMFDNDGTLLNGI